MERKSKAMIKSLRIHHIGYAVRNIDAALGSFLSIGYQTIGPRVADTGRNVSIQFVRTGDYTVELIAPLNGNSPVNNFLKKNGPAPYHICYEVSDIDKAVTELKSQGFIVIENISPAPAIENLSVAFLFKKELGLIELVEIAKE
jgi:methylmalonyl-CoA/ethylmalonyl-CoA epimerase